MGCSLSQQVTSIVDEIESTASSEDDDAIDVKTLFAALLKLSHTFNIKFSTMTSLLAVIRSERHTCFDDQFVGVEKWITRHSAPGTQLSPNEIYNLIRYVNLYDPPTEDTVYMTRDVRLLCPYRCDVAAWIAEIRGQEMMKTVQRQDSWTPSTSCRTFTERQFSWRTMDDLCESCTLDNE